MCCFHITSVVHLMNFVYSEEPYSVSLKHNNLRVFIFLDPLTNWRVMYSASLVANISSLDAERTRYPLL